MSDKRLEELAGNLRFVQERIDIAARDAGRDPSEITLIAVTKFFPASDVQHLYDLGIRDFGENRDDEGEVKSALIPADARWHFQGQIQGRKIASLVNWADQIHSLASLDHAGKCERILSELGESREFFIQINLEPDRVDRGGIALTSLATFLESLRAMIHVKVLGLMTVPPIESDPQSAFALIAESAARENLTQLSIGMSGDFEEAIAVGATHIRIGSSILGSRPPLA